MSNIFKILCSQRSGRTDRQTHARTHTRTDRLISSQKTLPTLLFPLTILKTDDLILLFLWYSSNISHPQTYQVCVSKHKYVVCYCTTELRTEVSCFTPPQQGELYLGCKTFGVINIVRSRIGSRRIDNATSLLAACDVSAIFTRATLC